MSDSLSNMSSPASYRICVSGDVPPDWSVRFLGMTVSVESVGDSKRSTLEGRLPDQSALAGVLRMIHEAHYAVLSVICLDAIADTPAVVAACSDHEPRSSLDTNQGT